MKIYLILLLLFISLLLYVGLTISAQEKPADTFKWTKANPESIAIALVSSAPFALQFYDGGKLVMKIDNKGHVTFGEGYSADAATKQFIESMQKLWPTLCGPPPSK